MQTARGGAVGWGSALQAGSSRVRFLMMSLEFVIDIILSATLWHWDRLSLEQKWAPGIFPGGKGSRYVGLTTLLPSSANFLEVGSLNLREPTGPVQACDGVTFYSTGHNIYSTGHNIYSTGHNIYIMRDLWLPPLCKSIIAFTGRYAE